MSPRPRATTDAELLAATQRAVTRLGPHLTLADVAREARVSPATLVQRFGSKRGLLLAFAAQGPAALHDEFARIRAASRSALHAVYATADCMAAMAPSPQALANGLAFLQMDLTDPDFHRHAHAHSRAMQKELTSLLDEAVRAGTLRPCDTRRLARAVQSLIGGSLLQWAIDRDTGVRTRLRRDLEMLLGPLTCASSPRRR